MMRTWLVQFCLAIICVGTLQAAPELDDCLPLAYDGLLQAPIILEWSEGTFTTAGYMTQITIQERRWRNETIRLLLWRSRPIAVIPPLKIGEPLFRHPAIRRFGGSWMAVQVHPFPDRCEWRTWNGLHFNP